MTAATQRNGRIEVSWRGDDVLAVALIGHQSAVTITRMRDELNTELGRRAAKFVFFDASRIEGFSPDVRGPGVEALRRILASGAAAVAVVTHSPVRMMAMAIAFAAGLRLEMFATRAEAERRIAQG